MAKSSESEKEKAAAEESESSESSDGSSSEEIDMQPPKSVKKPSSSSKTPLYPQPHSGQGSMSKEVEPQPPKSKKKRSTSKASAPSQPEEIESEKKKPSSSRARSSKKQNVGVEVADEADADRLKNPATVSKRKRPASDDEKETPMNYEKKKKMPKAVASEKKQLFQRIWSEEDEIILLKGLVDFKTEKKVDPSQDIDGFLAFIKDSLHMLVTKSQLQSKMKRLKKKYENNKRKEKDGKAKFFSNPHENETYRLSKLAWEIENRNANARCDEVEASAWGTENWSENGGEEVEAGALMKVRESVIEAEDKILVDGDKWVDKMERMSKEEKKQWKKLLVDEIKDYIRFQDTKTSRAELILRILKSDDARRG